MSDQPRRSGARRTSGFRRALSDHGLQQLDQVLSTARRLLDTSEDLDAANIHDFAAANRALDLVWNRATSLLRIDPLADERAATSDELVDLITDLRDVGTLVKVAESARKRESLAAMRAALAGLGSAGSVSEVVASLPNAMSVLGFDRSIVSRVQDLTWIPDAVAVSGDPAWAAEILEAGTANPRLIGPELVESEVLRRRTGILVTDVARHRGQVHTELVASTETRSYVAAPLMADGAVIGLLHADRYFHRGEVDEFDRDLLLAFAEGANFVLQRAAIADRIDALRVAVRRVSEGIWACVDWAGAPLTLGHQDQLRGPAEHAPGPPLRDAAAVLGHLAPETPLTRREIDVLELMALGETNQRIANRLIISEGTVKTHVRAILRKLQAANRAEAVARWLHSVNNAGGPARG